MTKKIIQNEMIANGIAKKHPIPRLGKGDDFGSLGAYLLNEEDSWITGQIFAIDGGRSTIIR